MNLSEDLDNDDSFQLLDVEDAQISNNTNMDTAQKEKKERNQ